MVVVVDARVEIGEIFLAYLESEIYKLTVGHFRHTEWAMNKFESLLFCFLVGSGATVKERLGNGNTKIYYLSLRTVQPSLKPSKNPMRSLMKLFGNNTALMLNRRKDINHDGMY